MNNLLITLQHDETGRLLEWSLESADPIPSGYSIVSNEQGPVFGNWKINPEWSENSTCPECNGLGKIQFSGGVGEELRDCPSCGKVDFGIGKEHNETINRIASLAAIGAAWRKDSSLEKWFPFTADQLNTLTGRHRELYRLVEAYLCTPNTTPAVKDAYDNLVAWFVRNKQPDGTEPRPVSADQQTP